MVAANILTDYLELHDRCCNLLLLLQNKKLGSVTNLSRYETIVAGKKV
jgi:hypothetical protein